MSSYGLIGRIRTLPGKRAELAEILLGGINEMPGCLSYIVAEDPVDPNVLVVIEVWTDSAAHKASLQLDSVKAAIAKGRPLIAGFDSHVEAKVLGGIGLSR